MAESKPKPKPNTVKGIRVTTKVDGFRRGGRAWTGTTEVPVSEFDKGQLKQIKSESLLVVQDINIPVDD